jgi:hypothetical protein
MDLTMETAVEIKTEVDITKYVLQTANDLVNIKDWLVNNVGPSENASSVTCRTGEGWEIAFRSSMEGDNYKYHIFVTFDRDDEAVMFKLMWP